MRMLAAVRTARDRMIVTWLSDSGMRIGELCGLSFCDLHLCRIISVESAKVLMSTSSSAATLTARALRRGVRSRSWRGSSPAGRSVARARRWSTATTSTWRRTTTGCGPSPRPIWCWFTSVGVTAGQALGTHGARQMIERAGRRAGLGLVKPHAFRHTWATALTEATGGNTKAVADEGGWSSSQTVEETYAHLAGDPTLEAALETIWGENR